MNFRNGVVGFTALAKIKTLRHELSHRCRKRIIPIMVQCDILEDLEILQSYFANLPKNSLLFSIVRSFVK